MQISSQDASAFHRDLAKREVIGVESLVGALPRIHLRTASDRYPHDLSLHRNAGRVTNLGPMSRAGPPPLSNLPISLQRENTSQAQASRHDRCSIPSKEEIQ
jgi:hypothetical protein